VNDLANVGLYDVNTIANTIAASSRCWMRRPARVERDDDGRFVSVAFEPPDD